MCTIQMSCNQQTSKQIRERQRQTCQSHYTQLTQEPQRQDKHQCEAGARDIANSQAVATSNVTVIVLCSLELACAGYEPQQNTHLPFHGV